jgi:hypothetical protein
MKRMCCVLAIGVAAVLFPLSISVAQTSTAYSLFSAYTLLDFESCVARYGIASNNFDMFGINSPQTKKAYKEFYACQDKGALAGEARFATLKEQLATNEAAKTALKELYIYWRSEMAEVHTRKNTNAVEHKFNALLERVRVEASW